MGSKLTSLKSALSASITAILLMKYRNCLTKKQNKCIYLETAELVVPEGRLARDCKAVLVVLSFLKTPALVIHFDIRLFELEWSVTSESCARFRSKDISSIDGNGSTKIQSLSCDRKVLCFVEKNSSS